MKKLPLIRILFVFTVIMSLSTCVEHTPDSENRLLEANDSSGVTQADIIEALEFAGIGIHKIQIGEFDSPYSIKFVIEEFKDAKLFRTDTLDYDIVNIDYAYADTNKVTQEVKYIQIYSQVIRLFSQNLEDRIHFEIAVPRIKFGLDVEFISTNHENFYKIVEYENTHWNLNEKVPLLLCGSSWADENGRRFCAANKMGDNSRSKELLDNSPHYVIISYITEEIEKYYQRLTDR